MTGRPVDTVRPLLRTRQVREFTDEPVEPAQLDALADVARWSGSSSNEQPWRFIAIDSREILQALAQAGLPLTRALVTAPAAIAIALPDVPGRETLRAYDEGRAAERIMVGATMLALGAGITFIRADVRAGVAGLLGVPEGWFVRTIVALGHPTAAALRPKSAPGSARRPRNEMVFRDRWGS